MFSKYTLNIAAWLFLPATILVLAAAGYFWYDSLSRRWDWERAEATVSRIEWKESTNSHGEPTRFAYAIFSFTTSDGTVAEARSQTAASNRPLYKVGDSQQVIYPPDAPQKAQEDIFLVQFLLPLVLTAAGMFVGFISALLFYLGHRAQNTPPCPLCRNQAHDRVK